MKKSRITEISKVLAITLSLTLPLTYATFVNLPPQPSYAQVNQMQTNQSSVTQQPMMCATTESTIQGPEYKQGPPFKEGQKFAMGLQGPRLELSGRVLSMNCKPVEGAVLNIWQADSNGRYDNEGYNLRGKIKTDKDGKYVLDTIYPGRLKVDNVDIRPRHIHVMVGIPGQPELTTQVYFEGQPRDPAVKDSLITKPITDANGTKIANFDFVIEDYRGFNLDIFSGNTAKVGG